MREGELDGVWSMLEIGNGLPVSIMLSKLAVGMELKVEALISVSLIVEVWEPPKDEGSPDIICETLMDKI